MSKMSQPWDRTAEEWAQILHSDLQKGLSSAAVEERLEQDGPNELSRCPRPTLTALFLAQLFDLASALLLAAAAASLAAGAARRDRADLLSYAAAKAILVVVVLNAGVEAWAEHRAFRALEAVCQLGEVSIWVVRGGAEVHVPARTIVRGDVVLLRGGDVVPADMCLCESEELKVDELAITGRAGEVRKTHQAARDPEGEDAGSGGRPPANCVSSGCPVISGRGRGIVTRAGVNTHLGHAERQVSGEEAVCKPRPRCGCLPDASANATPLQRQLDRLVARLGLQAVAVCAVGYLLGVLLDRTDPGDPDAPSWLYMISVAVLLAVAAVPQGVPLGVAISLSMTCSDLVRSAVLVRRPASVETLGAVSVICTHKTGALTEGTLSLVGMWVGGILYDVEGRGSEPSDMRIARAASGREAGGDAAVRAALSAGLLCSRASCWKEQDPATGEEVGVASGNSSEVPLVLAALSAGFSEDVRRDAPTILEVPFTTARRTMLVVASVAGRTELCPKGLPLPAGTKYLVVCKGAPELVLARCVELLTPEGYSMPLTDAARGEVLAAADSYARRALRVLAIATRTMPNLPYAPGEQTADDLTTEERAEACWGQMRLVALLSLADPERPGVRESIALSKGAGVRVAMVTGDPVLAAVAVARRVSILQPGDSEALAVLDCERLRPDGRYLPSDQMDVLTCSARIFARARHEDKLEIVKSLQRQGAVTLVTGEGVADAPVLKQADVGVAMGGRGTEVAKGAADIIVADDNFCSVVAAVEKARTFHAGVQKFVAFLLAAHTAEVLQVLVCVAAGIPIVRTPLQILFLVLVTDLPPSIALGMEPCDRSIMLERPRPKDQDVVLPYMRLAIALHSAAVAGVTLGVYLVALHLYCDGHVLQARVVEMEGYQNELMKARTVALVSAAWAEHARAYCARSFDQPAWRSAAANVGMRKAILATQICLYGAVFIPFVSDRVLELSGAAIGAQGWLLALAGPAGCFALCEAGKVITAWQVRKHQLMLALRRAASDARLAKAALNVQMEGAPQQALIGGRKVPGTPCTRAGTPLAPKLGRPRSSSGSCPCLPGLLCPSRLLRQ